MVELMAPSVCIGTGGPAPCSPTGAADEMLHLKTMKGNDGTPETGTTPTRSLSPSSDGNTSLPLSQHEVPVSGSGDAFLGDDFNHAQSAGSASDANGVPGIECEGMEEKLLAYAEANRAVETVSTTMVQRKREGLETVECGPDSTVDDGAGKDAADTISTSTTLISSEALDNKSPRSQDSTTSSSREAEMTVATEDTGNGTDPALEEAATRGKDTGITAHGTEGTTAVPNLAVGTGGAKASRAKAPGRSGHSGGSERWSTQEGDNQGSSGLAPGNASADALPADGSPRIGGTGASDTAPAQQVTVQATGTTAFALLPPVPSLGPTMNSFSDRRIIEVLAAPEATHRRLLRTARRVPEILSDPDEHQLVFCTELYGSLSLDMSEPNALRPWKQDWASYYVNGRSDVDFVVKTRHKVSPSAVAQRLLKKGPWRMVGQVQVHKFASTQFTLLGSFEDEGSNGYTQEVYLDITCIEQSLHFNRFKNRQEAFRKVFMEVRACIEGQYAAQGALAFDAYIHLLKAFAAKVPGNALTGFQATCIGLFTLQIGHFRMKPSQSIALSLFEGFLRFCVSFYSDMIRPADLCWHSLSYRQCAIDLSVGGRWLPRMSTTWHSELYFMAEEVKMQTRPDERMNVTHSLDPARVSVEALALLNRAFFSAAPANGGGAAMRTMHQQQQPAAAAARRGCENATESPHFSYSNGQRESSFTRPSEVRNTGAEVGCNAVPAGGKGCLPTQCIELVG